MSYLYVAFIAVILTVIGVLIGISNPGTLPPTPGRSNTKSPTTAFPTTSIPTVNPTRNPTKMPVIPTVKPTRAPVECTEYIFSNNGVPLQITYTPSVSEYQTYEFNGPLGQFAGQITFQYLDGQLKGFTYFLNPLPTYANFSFSTTNAPVSSYPIAIQITATEQETPFFDPNDCTPLPCTQNLYGIGRIVKCFTPAPTLAPGALPTLAPE